MARKSYDESELKTAWRENREATMRRSKSRNNSRGSRDNIRRMTVYVSSDFQQLEVFDPADITEQNFLDWIQGMRDGNFRTSKLSSKTIQKRVEILRAMLRAGGLKKQMEFVELWKPDREIKEIRYWSIEETEVMDNQALEMFEIERLRPRAMAHLIHSIMAPRISDSAAFHWKYFNFSEGFIQFRATKNGKICSQFIQERFLPVILRYRDWVMQFKGGDEYLFPVSILQSSGSVKRTLPHATDKSIRKWLAHVRDSTTLHGENVQKLPSHSYRHTLAMRYLANGCTFENIAMVLGDDIATVHKHYSELIPNDAQRIAFEQAHALSCVISSEGTAQPEWLKRKRGSNPARAYRGSGMNGGFKSKSGVDVGGFDPPASWLQTRYSSN